MIRPKVTLLLPFCLCFLQLQLPAQNPVWELIQVAENYQVQAHAPRLGIQFTADSLQVFVGKKEQYPGLVMPHVVGVVEGNTNSISYQPHFPFRAGVSYTAFLGRQHRFSFEIPKSSSTPNLLAIYPSVDEVPANLLKMYLYFSEPMSEGRAYDQLMLTNKQGDTIQQAFVPLQPELWSEDRKRLTLWLDPGRIKRGLLSHEAHGVVLEEGQEYTLKISPSWKDVHGNTLDKVFEKKFIVIAPDYQRPIVDQWIIRAPKVGSKEALTIDFGEPLDQALAKRHFQVHQLIDQPPLSGKIELSEQEFRWHFYPDSPWDKGKYIIVIENSLEDLAGNNLNRPFDRDLKATPENEVETKAFFTIHFEVK